MKKIFRNAIQEEKIQIIFVRAFPKVLQEGVKLNEKGGGLDHDGMKVYLKINPYFKSFSTYENWQ